MNKLFWLKNPIASLAYLIFLFFFINIQICFASVFASYPGTKAMSMAGAFTAVSDDASAVWYNPSGFADGTSSFICGFSQISHIDEKDGPLNSEEKRMFVGINASYEEFGVGIFYFVPYAPKFWSYDEGLKDWAWGKSDELIHIVSLPFAVSFLETNVKVGMTLEWVHLGFSDSQIYYRDKWNWSEDYLTPKSKADGISGSIGTLIKLTEADEFFPFSINIGGTYRFSSTAKLESKILKKSEDKGVTRLFFDKPESFDIGISSLSFLPSIDSQFLVSFQYGKVDWSEIRPKSLDYDKVSFGFDFTVTKKDFMFKKMSLRGGYYISTPSYSDPDVWNWPDVTGVTYGIGLIIGDTANSFCLDIAQERRTLDNYTSNYKRKKTLTSICVTWFF
ncbi:MAG: hypothetical protein HQK76_07935 [Desulfobacterales bacterium]|nr:hypothetical protein [Desulfobacterales bacterium]